MVRADDAEVAAIDCRDLDDAESFSSRDDRRVDGAQRQVARRRHYRVNDQRGNDISVLRISSMRTETSLCPLRPLAAAPRHRLTVSLTVVRRMGCQHIVRRERGPTSVFVESELGRQEADFFSACAPNETVSG
jgi:hypothetical protein